MGAKTAAVSLSLLCGTLFSASAVFAQSASYISEQETASTALPGFATAAPTQSSYTPDPQQTDLLQGQNKPGPYPLAWGGINVNAFEPVKVDVDGKVLSSDAYTLDIVKGTISYKDPLKTGSLSHVQYFHDVKRGVRNPDFAPAPLSLSQMNLSGTSVQFSSVPGASLNGTNHMVYGAQRNMSLLNGGLTSQMLFMSGGSATKLGYKLGGDKTGIDAQFQRTEKDFASKVGKSLGFADALQSMSLAARLRTATWMGTTLTRTEQKNLKDRSGKGQTAMAMAFGGVHAVPLLNIGHTIDEATAAVTGLTTTVTTDKADTGAKVGSAAFTAKGQHTVTDAPDPNAHTKAELTSFAVTTPLATKTTLASFAVTTTSTQTPVNLDGNQDMTIKLQPISMLTLSAEQKADRATPVACGVNGLTTSTNFHSAGAELVPIPGTKLTGAVQTNDVQTDVQASAKTAVTKLDATIGSGKAVELGGGVTNRSATTVGGMNLDTTQARLALRPMGGLTFTGAYTANPEANGVVSQLIRQELGIVAKMGAIDFGSNYAMNTVTGQAACPDEAQYGSVSVTVGMRLSKFTNVNGAFKDGMLYGDYPGLVAAVPSAIRGTRMYSLGMTHILGPDFSFVMNGSKSSDYTVIGKPVYKAEAKVGVRF